MEKVLLRLASILIACLGIYVSLRPARVAEKIRSFYSNYPIVRYAGTKQLTSRVSVVRAAGILLIIVGLVCLFSV